MKFSTLRDTILILLFCAAVFVELLNITGWIHQPYLALIIFLILAVVMVIMDETIHRIRVWQFTKWLRQKRKSSGN